MTSKGCRQGQQAPGALCQRIVIPARHEGAGWLRAACTYVRHRWEFGAQLSFSCMWRDDAAMEALHRGNVSDCDTSRAVRMTCELQHILILFARQLVPSFCLTGTSRRSPQCYPSTSVCRACDPDSRRRNWRQRMSASNSEEFLDAILREVPKGRYLGIRTYAAAWSTVSDGPLWRNDVSAIRQAGTLRDPPLRDTKARLTRLLWQCLRACTPLDLVKSQTMAYGALHLLHDTILRGAWQHAMFSPSVPPVGGDLHAL